MKTRFLGALIGLSVLVAACATPYENTDRSLSFAWSLDPETRETKTYEVDQGEVFFTWEAKAYSTHEISATGTKLAIADTKLGNLFCGNEAGRLVCYEDRDGDNAYDHKWTTRTHSVDPKTVTVATIPVPLETQLPYQAISETEEATPIVEQTLGMVFAGPDIAALDEDLNITQGFGILDIGWITEKDGIRKPNNHGWHGLRSFSMFYSSKLESKILVSPYSLAYSVSDMTVGGRLLVLFSADYVEKLKFRDKVEYDVQGDGLKESLGDLQGGEAT